MPPEKGGLHVHIWNYDQDENNPVQEIDLEMTDEYDDHYQYTFDLEEYGIVIEIRKWK